MGLFGWASKAQVRIDREELVDRVLRATKNGEIVWEPRGYDASNYNVGYKCRDLTSGKRLEFYLNRRPGSLKNKKLLVARDRAGAITGAITLREDQYALLSLEASKSAGGTLRRESVDLSSHRGPFL